MAVSDGGRPTDGDDPWEKTARQLAHRALFLARENVAEATENLEMKMMDDEEITKEDVRDARNAISELQNLLEADVVPVVDGVEPWDGAFQLVPYGSLWDTVDPTGEARELIDESQDAGEDE